MCCRCAGCLRGIETYLPGNVLQGYRLFKRCLNLPAEHGFEGVKAAEGVWEPTCRALCCSVQAFKWCRNLSEVHCVAGVQVVKVVSEPTFQTLCCRGAGCLSGVRTTCQLLGTVLLGCRLFKRCQNLPARHCVAWVQAV